MNNSAESKKLIDLLEKLSQAVEDILLTGLTAASESTCETLDQAFREASQLRLFRLGSTLRVASEEIGAFIRNDESFSPKRLSFFLNRAWMLSQGMIHALVTENDEQWQTLTWSPQGIRTSTLDVVTLGVSKRVVPGAFCAFEFRLRSVAEADNLPISSPLVWSCVFPMRPGVDVPPEGYLRLPQKQKFKASDFLEQKVVRIENALVSQSDSVKRITLDDSSTVTLGSKFEEWERFDGWDAKAALARIQSYTPGPFDLDVELQEEVILTDWTIGEPIHKEQDRMMLYPIASGELLFHAQVPISADAVLQQAMDNLRKADNSLPLFALMHYEMCQLVLQPLAVLGSAGPDQLGLSKEKIDAAALVRSLKFL